MITKWRLWAAKKSNNCFCQQLQEISILNTSFMHVLLLNSMDANTRIHQHMWNQGDSIYRFDNILQHTMDNTHNLQEFHDHRTYGSIFF